MNRKQFWLALADEPPAQLYRRRHLWRGDQDTVNFFNTELLRRRLPLEQPTKQ
ncbi:hypothetical protein [Solirubrum puertoriconensis]|uniref:hypothetical protein n=1 Tax=Solirubrum puertoriconensis TaxID=1751427 RepID=UPI0013652CDD|nr:hypothetical protein [Solirubrum puertoriconensis]